MVRPLRPGRGSDVLLRSGPKAGAGPLFVHTAKGNTMTLLDLDGLLSIQSPTVDLEINGLGTVRLQRLFAGDKLRVIDLLGTVERTEAGEIVNQADALAFGCLLLSLAIVDEGGQASFDSDDGRAALGRLPLGQLQQLTAAAIELNGMGPETKVSDEIDEAKKN